MDDLVSAKLSEWLSAWAPTTFRSLELEIAAVFRDLGDKVTTEHLSEVAKAPAK